ncbi:hypothetical protein KBD61_01280 [Patescibacteria group bacterium]|nr:hypothetical protein [Patescibacteria group bacterium]
MLIALLIGISTFSSSQASSDLLSFLWPLILLLLALYLIYRGRASAKRIFFDAQHVYLGKEEADARPETAYGGMYYNMRKAVSFNDLLAWRGTPNVIVFRKRLVWPIYFYYVIDTLFPASNANRQVFLLQMGQIVREAGGLPTPVRASDSNGYLQDDLLQFTLKRCEQNHIQVYRKDLYSLVPVVATLFFLGVGALILFPSLLRQF